MELRDYVPEDMREPDRLAVCRPQPRTILPHILTETTSRGSISFKNLAVYRTEPNCGVLPRETVLSAHSIIGEIQQTEFPEVPARGADTLDNIPGSWWEYIRDYQRIVGTLAHEEIAMRTASFDKIPEINQWENIQTRHQAIGEWPGSPLTEVPDKANIIEDSQSYLTERARDESYYAAENYRRWAQEHGLNHPLGRELIVISSRRRQGVGYGCQLDVLGYPENSSELPQRLTVVEIKIAESIRARHVVQAECYRRAVDEKLPARVEAVVVRVGLDRDGECSHFHSGEQGWPEEEAWSVFTDEAEQLYGHYKVEAELDIFDARK